MKNNEDKKGRRKFIKTIGTVGAALPIFAPSILESANIQSEAKLGQNEILLDIENRTRTTSPLLPPIDKQKLKESVLLACNWLINIAQVKTEKLKEGIELNPQQYPYENWNGAIRNEYSHGQYNVKENVPPKTWHFYGTIWHTGQALRALSLAYEITQDKSILQGAKNCADFILRNQINDKKSSDYGLIYAFENFPDIINSSAVMECSEGLYELSRVTGDMHYSACASDALKWLAYNQYKGGGLFHDGYNPFTRKKDSQGWKSKFGIEGRPLIDDGVILKASKELNDEKMRKVFFEVADNLIAVEDPKGNWINYNPCRWQKGSIHPRHAYWWGRPMWMAFKESGDIKYKDCFDRACNWYKLAMRKDGGIFRGTYTDFNTGSFDHETSGVGAACIMFHDQVVYLGNSEFNNYFYKGIEYMMNMQVNKAADPNMLGVIIEKINPPDGTDSSPIHIRDLGTSFFVTAASLYLRDI